MPKHIYEGTEFRKNPMNDKAIGTGPFKLKEWVRGSHVHLVRHEGYYRKDEPYLDEIIYRIIPDGASRALALENGTVQLVQWSDIEFFDVQRFKSQKNLEFTTKGYEYFAPHQWLEMNNRVVPMNNKRFRQAIMHLIDRDAMNKQSLSAMPRSRPARSRRGHVSMTARSSATNSRSRRPLRYLTRWA